MDSEFDVWNKKQCIKRRTRYHKSNYAFLSAPHVTLKNLTCFFLQKILFKIICSFLLLYPLPFLSALLEERSTEDICTLQQLEHASSIATANMRVSLPPTGTTQQPNNSRLPARLHARARARAIKIANARSGTRLFKGCRDKERQWQRDEKWQNNASIC